MGWTTWNLEDVHRSEYTITWLNAANTRKQADILRKVLGPYGYNYVNVDSGWCGGFDKYGRPIDDLKRFPGGMAALAKYVHHNGQKLGIYWIPGIQHSQWDANPPILGTKYHIRDIVAQPISAGNAFGEWHNKIDFSKPGAQEYIDSVIKLWASWGIDYLKMDGVGPGSDSDVDSRDNIAAYSKAIKKCGRPIWFELSWRLDHKYVDFWQKNSNGWRVNDDVDSLTHNISGWSQIQIRFAEAPQWSEDAGPGKGWNDFDAAPVGDGELDGLTDDERRTCMTLWAIECSPLFIGDDLAKLDSFGIKLLTNREVIAVNQAGRPAIQMVGGSHQVWRTDNGDGTVTVALFNLGNNAAHVSVNLDFLGYSGNQPVHDLWSHEDLGMAHGVFAADLSPHACRLVRIGVPAGKQLTAATRTAANQPTTGTVVPAAPGGLKTDTGSASVKLAWTPSSNATHYIVWRSLNSHADYRIVDAHVSGATYTDRAVVDGTPYYYQISAVGPGGNSPRSAPAGVIPMAGGHSNVISLSFAGGSSPMDIDEVAGVVPAMHWNGGYARTGDIPLIDGSGNDTGAYLTFVAGGSYLTDIPDRPGNDRMMRGYLETYGHDTTSVTVTDLPEWFTKNGYDVYVYSDGGNGKSVRVAKFSIDSTYIIVTDAAGSDFHGSFVGAQSTGGKLLASDEKTTGANYVEFKDLIKNTFTLRATPVSSTDEYLRAPVNGIQLVAHSPDSKRLAL